MDKFEREEENLGEPGQRDEPLFVGKGEGVTKKVRPRIPAIREDQFDDFEQAVQRAEKRPGYGKWFIALVLFGILVWMVPASFESEERIEAKKVVSARVHIEQRDIQLFLPDKSRLGLIATKMRVDLGGTVEEKIDLVLKALFTENQTISGVFPPEIIVRDVFVNEDEAIISLDGVFKKRFMGGSWSELLAVYSLVNTITENFDEVNSVRILINDRETEFFVSHVDVTGSLRPRFSLLILDETPDI